MITPLLIIRLIRNPGTSRLVSAMTRAVVATPPPTFASQAFRLRSLIGAAALPVAPLAIFSWSVSGCARKPKVPQKPKVPPTPHVGEVITEKNFEEKVLKSRRCAVVFFTGRNPDGKEWCEPCKKIAMVLRDLEGNYKGRVDFFEFEVNDERDLIDDKQYIALQVEIYQRGVVPYLEELRRNNRHLKFEEEVPRFISEMPMIMYFNAGRLVEFQHGGVKSVTHADPNNPGKEVELFGIDATRHRLTGMTKRLAGLDLQERIVKSPLPVFVYFSSKSCGECEKIAPIMNEIPTLPEYQGKVRFIEADVDDLPSDFFEQDWFRAMFKEGEFENFQENRGGLPVTLFIKDGTVVSVLRGVIIKDVKSHEADTSAHYRELQRRLDRLIAR